MSTSANLQNFTQAHLELDPNKILYGPDDKGRIQYEKWKDVVGYKKLYRISDFGRVKSLERSVKNKHGYRIVKEKILRQQIPQRYFTVSLKKNQKPRTHQVHQLVAIAFLNHRPCGFEKVVDHKDNIKNRNFVWNLQIISNRLNASKDRSGYSSDHIGVYWNSKRKRWGSSIYKDGENIHLGYFKDEKLAAEFYKKAVSSIRNGTEIEIKRKKNTSKYRGVHKNGTKWKAQISNTHLGTFDTEKEASEYANYAIEIIENGGNPSGFKIKELVFSSKLKGVSWSKSRKNWRSQVWHNGTNKILGSFSSEEEAHQAYLDFKNMN